MLFVVFRDLLQPYWFWCCKITMFSSIGGLLSFKKGLKAINDRYYTYNK